MSFRDEIAILLKRGEPDDLFRYKGAPVPVAHGEIIRKDLSEVELEFLTDWMKSDDPALQESTGNENHIVKGAIKQFRIVGAKYGIAEVKARNTRIQGEADDLLSLAKASREAAKAYRDLEARREVLIMFDQHHLNFSGMSFGDMALIHEDSAAKLTTAADNRLEEMIPTKQKGGDGWRRAQFIRGMRGEIDQAKWWGWQGQDTEIGPELDSKDYELVAALVNLIFGTSYTAKNVRDAPNTTRSSRSSKVLKRKRDIFRRKSTTV
jgi:hypothetical protein